ncbi:MAG: SpoIID/LytB domain-containing protein, partial [Acidimicrobiales bacterium]
APAAPSAGSPAPSATTTTRLLGLIPVGPVRPAPTTPPAAAPPPPPPAPPEPISTRSLSAVPKGTDSVAVTGLGRAYRGSLQAVAAAGGLELVNQVDVEQYLRGMGEIRDPGWPAAALRAQAIAARTYALRSVAAGRPLCSDDQCQVYLGQQAEYAAMDKAVNDTRGQVLVYGGALADAVYSANGGGISATPEEGFGQPDAEPYLRAAPYRTADPDPWTVRADLAATAARVGYRGQATRAVVSRAGPSGRALEVTFDGNAGPLAVDGRRFATVLGLRSTLFTLALATDGPGDPLVPDPAAAPTPPGQQAPGRALVAAGSIGPTSAPLGRSPEAALAILLLAAWGLGATWTTARSRDGPS